MVDDGAAGATVLRAGDIIRKTYWIVCLLRLVNIRLGQAWEKYGVIDWLVGKSLGAGGMDGSVGHGMALCGAGAVDAVGGFMVAFVLVSTNCIRVFVVLDS
jgi:hypothetical protein